MDFTPQIKELFTDSIHQRSFFDFSKKEQELSSLEKRVAEPNFWQDQNQAKEILARINYLKSIIEPIIQLQKDLTETAEFHELFGSEDEAEEEINIRLDKIQNK